METKLLFLAIFLIFIILSTEARSKRKSREWRLVPIGKQRKQRPSMKLKRKIIITEGKELIGKGDFRKIVDLPPEKKEASKSEHFIEPELMDKFRKVKNMQDFVRLFKPPGFTIKEELVPGLKNRGDGINGNGKDNVAVKETNIYYQGRKYTNVALDSTNTLGCAPQRMPQSLETLGKITYPSCTWTKRCGGCCPAAMECVVSTKTKKEIDVFEISKFIVRRAKRTIVEHSSCRCQCIVQARDCLPTQTYSAKRCQCECNRSPTMCGTGKIWVKQRCACQCMSKRVCSSPLRQWDENTCRCGCIKKACPFGQVRNMENCRCEWSSGDTMEPFRRDFQKESEDRDTDDSSQDDFWGDF